MISLAGLAWIGTLVGCPTRDTDTDSTPPATGAGGPVYLVLHLDPGGTEHLDRVDELLMSELPTREVSHRFTVLMTSEWAAHALNERSEAIPMMRQWLDAGHELGWHHHTPGHGAPDGFSVHEDLRNRALCCASRGPSCDVDACDVSDAVALIDELITTELAATLDTLRAGPEDDGGATSYRDEVPADFRYSTTSYPADLGGTEPWSAPEDPTSLHGEPTCLCAPAFPDVRSQGVWALPHAQYDAELSKANAVPLALIEQALDAQSPDDYLGLVWHEDAFVIADQAAHGTVRVRELLDALERRGRVSQTVSSLVAELPAECAPVTADCAG